MALFKAEKKFTVDVEGSPLTRILTGIERQKAEGQTLRYATVCLTLNPKETPEGFLKKALRICAQKLGSNDVQLTSHLMMILNVSFHRRNGPLPPEVLLIKNSTVNNRAGEAEARDGE